MVKRMVIKFFKSQYFILIVLLIVVLYLLFSQTFQSFYKKIYYYNFSNIEIPFNYEISESLKIPIINETLLNISTDLLLLDYFKNVSISFFENDDLPSIAKNSFQIAFVLSLIKKLKNLEYEVKGKIFNESIGYVILLKEKECKESYVKGVSINLTEICGKNEKELELATMRFLIFLMEKAKKL
jgi:hypothetical protein